MGPGAPVRAQERTTNLGLACGLAIAPKDFSEVVRTMALRHQKWDAQVGDGSALAPFPLVLKRETWEGLTNTARELANETLAVERELTHRADLDAQLALPNRLSSVFRAADGEAPVMAT